MEDFLAEIDEQRAYLVTVNSDETEAQSTLAELADLAKSAGFIVAGEMVQSLSQPDGSTYVGSGKLQEISQAAVDEEVGHLIFDTELSPAQFRNLAGLVPQAVHDRTGLILSLFSQHARSDEGKIQVELARLRYRLTRLAGKGVELSRLGGGIGTRGPGEKKIEVDRRRINSRMGQLRRDLEKISARRDRNRSSRQRRDVFTVAVVGYTNAGKSTLVNALAGSEIPAGNRLFMTLDPTVRRIETDAGVDIVLADTVGFIRDMPKHLTEAFRATFEEVLEADLLLIVLDISDTQAAEQCRVVDLQLAELGASEIERVYVLNKMDRCDEGAYHAVKMLLRRDREEVVPEVSAKEGMGLSLLRDLLVQAARRGLVSFELRLPYEAGDTLAYIQKHAIIQQLEYESGEVHVRGLIAERYLGKIKPSL